MPDLGSRPRWTIARRDLTSLSREKTIVLALLIQLFIAGFSSFLVVGLSSPYDPDSVEDDVVNVGATGETRHLLHELAFQSESDVVVSTYADRDEAVEDFAAGDLDAVLTARPVPTEGGTRIQADVIIPAEDIQTTPVVVSVRELLVDLESHERTQRASHLEVTPVAVPDATGGDTTQFFGFAYTILIPLLLFLPPFISGALAVDAITEEIERGTLELLRVSPATLVDIVEGKALGMLALAPLQALLWIGLLTANGIPIGNPLVVLGFVTAMATIAVVVGLVLGLVTGQRRRAQFLYSMLVIFLFGAATLLPEHPVSTVVKLAVDSATLGTYGHVLGLATVAVGAAVLARRYVTDIDPETI